MLEVIKLSHARLRPRPPRTSLLRSPSLLPPMLPGLPHTYSQSTA